MLMASRSGVPVYVGADRMASINKLLDEQDCDVVVSDDGMQHYKLPRDIQIAVIDQTRQLGNGWCLPAGPMREPKKRLEQCDFIVVNGSDLDTKNKQQYTTNVPEFGMQLSGTRLINLKTKQEKPLTEFVDKTLNAVSGIGNPQRFFMALQSAGLTINSQSFPDHHPFTASDFKSNHKQNIVMTEKDAVKCQGFATDNMWYLPVTATLDTFFESQILDQLTDIVKAKNAQHR